MAQGDREGIGDGFVFGYVQREDAHCRAECLVFVDVAGGCDVEFLQRNALLGTCLLVLPAEI